VSRLVNQLDARIDWPWALNGGATLSHGWRPETGFIPHRWDSYAELLGLYLLDIGASTGALPETTWHAWPREPRVPFAGRTFIQCGPLFTHHTNRPKLLDLTADYADHADNGNITAISEIRGQSAWVAINEKCKSKVRLALYQRPESSGLLTSIKWSRGALAAVRPSSAAGAPRLQCESCAVQ
jgi:hypothetical protein